MIENARLTGTLLLTQRRCKPAAYSSTKEELLTLKRRRRLANCGFRQIVEITTGGFEFQKSEEGFPVTHPGASNTNLILDALRQLDEEKQ